MTGNPVDLVERIVERGGDADDVLRSAVAALAADPGVDWVGIAFVEGGELRLGPAAGATPEATRTRVPILFQGVQVAELQVDGDIDQDDLGRIASLVAPYALIGWDTGGEAWEP